MLEDRKNKCLDCNGFIGYHTPDTIFNNYRCKKCKSEYRFLDIKECKDRNNSNVLVCTTTGTTRIAGIFREVFTKISTTVFAGVDTRFVGVILDNRK